MEKFYLISTELREPYEPRACRKVRRLRSEFRDDLALVEVEPSLPRHVYGTDQDIRLLILASRHEGQSLFPIREWPLAVYICRLKDREEPEGDVIRSGDLAILDWGELRETPEDKKHCP
jgi:hypothetical protein